MSEHDVVEDLHARAARIRTDMGGAERVARMRAEGDHTVREHIDAFLDPGTFRELGTFARSARPEDRRSPSSPISWMWASTMTPQCGCSGENTMSSPSS